MNKKYVLGIIGGGNMATAIVNGILRENNFINAQDIILSDINEDKLKIHKNLKINTTINNQEIYTQSEYILFAIKPQIFYTLKDSLHLIQDEQNIISIMAGINIETIKKMIGTNLPVCRVMPNTPCMIGEGMSVISCHKYNARNKEFVYKIFYSIGNVIELDENLFDTVTSISGSGPAYVYTFINAMVKGGILGGLTEKDCRELVITTFIGAAKMIQHNPDKPIEQLIEAVCSKGGTTIEAINKFNENNLMDIIIQGIKACRLRSKELSGK